ncbi:MAG: glycosyltransferase [Nanoarchaeota archaeon]|nr:glycosyltransferase [Nanoarchaeota archaeon]
MKAGMVFPDRTFEKAISSYSYDLVENIKKAGFSLEEITYSAGKPLSLFKKFSEIRKFDVIHIQHEYNLLGLYGIPFFFLYFYLFLSNVKIVTTMHTALSMKENFKGSKLKTLFRKILYFTQNRVIKWCSKKTIVHANFFKEILIKEYSFNPENVIVFPQAIIEKIKITPKEEAKKQLKLSGPVYLFMGGMVPDHGHDIIIKQSKKIGATILVVANPGAINDRNDKRTKSFLEENIRYVKKNNLSKYVRFDIFDINDKNPKWWKYFSAADLVLLPYRGGIGSGVYAHAMAAEVPVVASNILFFKEISEKFGCLKIAKKESDYPEIMKEAVIPINLKKMVLECKRYKKQFGLSNLSKEYKKVYKSLAN